MSDEKAEELEKRVLILFFVITFSIILVLSSVGWLFISNILKPQLAKYKFILLPILLVFVIGIIILFAKLFTKNVVKPLKGLSVKMQSYTENAPKFEPIAEKYSGVLGDIAETFNSMNRALAKFSKTIKEYETIEENLGFGVFWLDYDFSITFCNPGLIKIFGQKDREQIIGKNLCDFVEISEEDMQKAREDRITLPELELNLQGRKSYVMLNIRAVSNEHESSLIASIKDISKEKKEKMARDALELALIKTSKLAEIGKKVEGIVHNINSPLNSIFGHIQFIKKEIGNSDDVDKIISAGENISHTIKGLLRKSKHDFDTVKRLVSINEIVKQELDQCGHNLFFKHSVSLETDLSEGLPEIRVVRGDISQCVTNILNNSIESVKDSIDKDMFVRTYKTSNMVAVDIRDTGKGIEEGDSRKIFEPYFTTKSGETGSGYGLGLSISKDIAEKYFGYITFSSKVGFGSTFTIFLPFEK